MLPFLYPFYRLSKSILTAVKDPEFEALLVLVVTILLSGMFFYHSVEGWTYLDSLFFSVVTLTTVGYGNFVPLTVIGKIFTMVYIFVGLGIIFGFINTIAHHAIEDVKGQTLPSERLRLRRFRRGNTSDAETENT